MRRTAALVVLLLTGACGRLPEPMIPFSAPGTGQKMLVLEDGKDVIFWTDFKASFDEDKVGAKYHIELSQDGVFVGDVFCDPNVMKGICSLNIIRMTYHHTRCRMHCSARVPKSGPTLVRATLLISGDTDSLLLDRADLSIEQ
jgi:hypothetical protein